ncbi:hypothetical protein Q1695_015532 [Nippostrongylus brasiliensis]|nr:hypothetical protein Q1695_015532 [Nippostrongylus brasiliensis]
MNYSASMAHTPAFLSIPPGHRIHVAKLENELERKALNIRRCSDYSMGFLVMDPDDPEVNRAAPQGDMNRTLGGRWLWAPMRKRGYF